MPWSEYIPLEHELAGLGRQIADWYVKLNVSLNPHLARMEPGTVDRMTAFSLAGANGAVWRFGVSNCFEIASAAAVNEWHRHRDHRGAKGVHFIVNPANEILLGGAIHNQMLRAARLRAIEGRVSVVRVANNGISALIDPRGVVVRHIADAAGKSTDVSGFGHFQAIIDSRYPSVYAMIGDVFPILCKIGRAHV